MRLLFEEILGEPCHESWRILNRCRNPKCRQPAHHELIQKWAAETYRPLPLIVPPRDELDELIELIECQASRDAQEIHQRYPLYSIDEIEQALEKTA